MNSDFSRTLSLLRREKGISQRQAAAELGISQALLSHYENKLREPGLDFVIRACDYYSVSADYLLGRTLAKDGSIIDAEGLFDVSEQKDNTLRGSVMATLHKKLLVNAISVLYGILGTLGSTAAVEAASNYLNDAVYHIWRMLFSSNTDNRSSFFALSDEDYNAGAVDVDMMHARMDLQRNLNQLPEKTVLEQLDFSSESELTYRFPNCYPSLLKILHIVSARGNSRLQQPVPPKKK